MTDKEAIEILKGILTEATEFSNSVCYVTEKDREPLEMAIKALENQKTGHWIEKDEKSAVCSCCNRNNTLYGDFCKWCGAKMKEED